ncbi:MAG: penicillin-binding protein 2 [Chloroflexia bacterium]
MTGPRKQKPLWRFLLLRMLLLAAFAALGARLWYLQIVEGARYREVAEGNRRRVVPMLPLRGRIFDRTGRLLAENVPSFTLMATLQGLPEGEAERSRLFDRLCALLNCEGILEVNSATLEPSARDTLFRWLDSHLEPGYPESLETMLGQDGRFSVTLRLSEPDASWLRSRVAASNGLTYTTSLQQALRENAGPTYLPVPLAENLPRDVALLVEEHRLELPGIYVQTEPLRRYPTGALTAHIVGYVGRITAEELAAENPEPKSGLPVRYLENDRIGKLGAERAFESLLRGELGLQEIQVDASGRPVGTPFWTKDPRPGYDIVLTLDTDLQEKATAILESYIRQAELERPRDYRPVTSGVAIVMDVRNGQVLAMVSWPNYDNNLFARGITPEEFRALLDDPRKPLVNRAIAGSYPPGSTFKVVVASAALQEKVITPKTRIFDGGALLVPNRYDPSLPPQVFPCWLRSGHGWQTVDVAIRNSCNVFFFTVAGGTPDKQYQDGLGIERFVRYARAFGFGEPTGLGLPGEASGLIPTPEWKESTLGEPWVQGDLYNMAIGQGNLLVTPLQLVNAVAAIANGGTLYRPQLLLRVQDSEGQVVSDFRPVVIRQLPIEPDYLAVVRQGMRRVVTESATDYARTHASVAIAGKTGSAEFGPFLRPGIRQAHAWFVGFAPYEDPQVAVAVVVEGGGQGSRIAMPAVTDIIEYYFTRPAGPASEDPDGGTGSAQR